MKTQMMKSVLVEDEPGDATKYKFVFTRLTKEFVFIYSLTANFRSEEYSIPCFNRFLESYPVLKNDIGYDGYSKTIIESGLFEDNDFKFICNIDSTNPWTLVAVIRMFHKIEHLL